MCDGKFQVAQSTAGFESLEKCTAFYEDVTAQLGDPAAVSTIRSQDYMIFKHMITGILLSATFDAS